MTDPKENLLPCPFCGSPGVIIENIGRSKGESKKHHAGCDNPKCDMYGGLCSWHHKREDTIAAWNRRVTPELAQRVIELEAENAKLRAVAQAAKRLYEICFDMPIDFPSAGPFVWGMGDLKEALIAAGYGGEE